MSGLEERVGALTVKALPEYAMEHGACKISETVREGRSVGRWWVGLGITEDWKGGGLKRRR